MFRKHRPTTKIPLTPIFKALCVSKCACVGMWVVRVCYSVCHGRVRTGEKWVPEN